MLEVLRNPMLLTLYAGYRDSDHSDSYRESIINLKKERKLVTIDSEDACRSYILWNYVEYNILYDKVFKPLLEAERPEERSGQRE